MYLGKTIMLICSHASLLFIYDLTEHLSSHVRLYNADDCCICRKFSSKSDSEQLQKDLNEVMSWCSTYNMTLNLSKYNLLRFTNKKHPLMASYVMNTTQMSLVTEYECLGSIFFSNLTGNAQVDYIVRKASNTLNFLRNNFKEVLASLNISRMYT